MRNGMPFVRSTIARHVGCPSRALHPRQRLERDLDLTPLELVLIAIEIEEAFGIGISIEGLAGVGTLGDLMRFFSHALSSRRMERRQYGAHRLLLGDAE